jgi:glycogen phosphorylase
MKELGRGRINMVFLPEYDASLAERLIPGSDVSQQISTAAIRPAARVI